MSDSTSHIVNRVTLSLQLKFGLGQLSLPDITYWIRFGFSGKEHSIAAEMAIVGLPAAKGCSIMADVHGRNIGKCIQALAIAYSFHCSAERRCSDRDRRLLHRLVLA